MPDLDDIERRFTYHPPKSGQPELYERTRHMALGLALWMDNNAPECRELSTAITKLEEAVMWFNAAVARRT